MFKNKSWQDNVCHKEHTRPRVISAQSVVCQTQECSVSTW